MKKILLLLFLVLTVFLSEAQRFFYIEPNDITGKLLRDGLLKGSQYVARSPLGSDYIIKTDVGFQSGSNILNLKMTVQDSITYKTIFQKNEDYTCSTVNANTQIFLRIAITTFIDKNINQIIVCAKDDHYDASMRFVKPRKDKT